jgi:hypothetical protein
MRERQRDRDNPARALDNRRGDAVVLSIYGRGTIASMTERSAAAGYPSYSLVADALASRGARCR